MTQSSCSTDLASQLLPGHGGDQAGDLLSPQGVPDHQLLLGLGAGQRLQISSQQVPGHGVQGPPVSGHGGQQQVHGKGQAGYLLSPRQGVPEHQEQEQQLLQGLGAGQTLQISSQQVSPGDGLLPGPGGDNLEPQTFQLPDLADCETTSTPQDHHSIDPCHTTPTSDHNSVTQSSCSTDLASQLLPGHGGDQAGDLLSPQGVPDHQLLLGLGAGQRLQISSQQVPGHGVQGPPVSGHGGQQQVHGQALAHGQVISKPGTMESTLGSSNLLEIVSWSPDNVVCEPRPEATLGLLPDLLRPVQQAVIEEPVRESRKRKISEPDYRFDSFRMKSIIAT